MKTIPLNLNNELFCHKFINLLMYDGKKLKATKIFLSMLNLLRQKIDSTTIKKNNLNNQELPLIQYIFKAVENVKPTLEVKKVRVAGTTYLVPAVLSKKKQENLAIRWIIDAAKKRKQNSSYSFSKCLAEEVYEALKQQGQARQKRDELHRVAEANRAYIRYRWW